MSDPILAWPELRLARKLCTIQAFCGNRSDHGSYTSTSSKYFKGSWDVVGNLYERYVYVQLLQAHTVGRPEIYLLIRR